jgi:hypothetical protein
MRISQTFEGQSGGPLREEEWFLKGVEYYDIGKIALGAPLPKPSDEDDARPLSDCPRSSFSCSFVFPRLYLRFKRLYAV